ncbi:MAG: thioredoxin domain-containing protein [Candidatus Omnitrophica bacterium]|nr:thioredoxin domain-containing protein [Candidatus Omnitrophota bacterium]
MSTDRMRAATWCMLLSLIGLGLSGYLAYLHLGLLRGELLGGAACSGSGAFNCHAVTGGNWGQLFGMPLALWGAIGYVTVLALALFARQSDETAEAATTLLVVLSTGFVLADAGLFLLMAFVIRFYCLFCLLTYAVNIVLLIVSLRAFGAPWARAFAQAPAALQALAPSRPHSDAGLFWGLVAAGIAGAVSVHAATTFVSQGSAGAMRKQVREFALRQNRVTVDVAGDPRLGSPAAPIQLIEFSDFYCPACQRASKFNTIMLAGRRRDATFVFKHFPLDTACNDKVTRLVHAGACKVAAASECAHEQGQFWPFHDMVFGQGATYNLNNLEGDVTRLGIDLTRFRACLDSGRGMEAVKRDIAEAGKIQVTSTPTYIVNGIPMAGGLSPAVFEEIVAVLQELQ